jgi:hypothetical protein
MVSCTKLHSWYDLHVHVTRGPDKKIIQAVCGELCIFEDRVGIYVNFTERGIKKRKLVSPIFLIGIQILWVNHDIISDTEDEISIPQSLPPVLTVSECSIASKKNVLWTLKQTNQLRCLFKNVF